jgi:uncharacterized repeat protein (TIGR03803 family)
MVGVREEEPSMTRLSLRARWVIALGVTLLAATPAAAQVVILHSFAGGPDGQEASGSLTVSGTTFFGMTSAGGTGGKGTVFRIGTDGTGYGLLHSFAGGLSDGSTPFGSLTQSGSTLFGMTDFGGNAGSGTVFKVNFDGTGFGLVHQFAGGPTDGGLPLGSLARSGSTLYGMTPRGGAANLGTVFQVNADGTGFGLLHSFSGGATDGSAPGYSAPAVSGTTLYGLTTGGGSADLGTVFKTNTDGTAFSVLHTFDAASGDGWFPYGSPTLSGSTMYGMTGSAAAEAAPSSESTPTAPATPCYTPSAVARRTVRTPWRPSCCLVPPCMA